MDRVNSRHIEVVAEFPIKISMKEFVAKLSIKELKELQYLCQTLIDINEAKP